MENTIRKPAFAGTFYPANRNELLEMLEYLDKNEGEKVDKSISAHSIIGGIVPHAGYIYSGRHAVHYFKLLQNSRQHVDTIVILNPNHNGFGPAIALDGHSFWETPLGKAQVDREFCDLLDIHISSYSHEHEHSGEVMIPFIQFYLSQLVRIVPISILDQSYTVAKELAKKLKGAISKSAKKVQIIASSDFSHFLSAKDGQRLDAMVIQKILKLDSKGVSKTVKENKISVCGISPIMALVEYCKINSEKTLVKVLSKGHSGEVSPSMRVVDYVSMVFLEK
jgi:hypothetical protein